MQISYIECNDYNVGKFIPISFDPVFNWTIIRSEFLEHPNKLPRIIIIKTIVNNYGLYVYSHPYSYGNFSADGFTFGFGGKYNWLGTNDPEEAIYLTEKKLLKWTEVNINWYKRIINKYYEITNKL